MLLHGVISLPDATSCDKFGYLSNCQATKDQTGMGKWQCTDCSQFSAACIEISIDVEKDLDQEIDT